MSEDNAFDKLQPDVKKTLIESKRAEIDEAIKNWHSQASIEFFMKMQSRLVEHGVFKESDSLNRVFEFYYDRSDAEPNGSFMDAAYREQLKTMKSARLRYRADIDAAEDAEMQLRLEAADRYDEAVKAANAAYIKAGGKFVGLKVIEVESE